MSSNISEDEENFLPDFPRGPLDHYRKQASFDWKEMALTIEKKEVFVFKHKIWKILENDPLFAHSPVELSMEESRRVTINRIFRLAEPGYLPEVSDPELLWTQQNIFGQYDWSLSLRRGVLLGFFPSSVRGQGTNQHYNYVDAANSLKLMGCVALTEISHGTNTRAFKTTATYDPNRKTFILNSPDFESAKCWAANLAKTATHAFVMAQLYTPDGIGHGLHSFVVPIRNPKTMLPYPGITIGDMGEKIGLNGLDNGYMLFDNYEISHENLLNRNGDVTLDGKYITPFKDPKKRFGATVGNLSAGRVGITFMCVANMCNALTIAVRYSAVRRQFGGNNVSDNDTSELPVLEYQMQQWRLFPYLAATYVMKFFSISLIQDLVQFMMSQFDTDVDADMRAMLGAEIHAISSSAKPLAGWLARDSIQECREACGGHGYLRCAGIGRLRNDNDATLTYEGDNNVLIQQTSNWLLNIWANSNREDISKVSPLGSLSFLQNVNGVLSSKFRAENLQELMKPTVIIDAYKWLVCWLLQSSAEKFHSGQQSGKDIFTARNDSQVYYARGLSIAFIEHCVLERFWLKFINRPHGLPTEIRKVLENLILLYGLWSLEKHIAILYQGGYVTGSLATNLIREGILELCSTLKGEAVALVDSIAPSDFILNSALGNSDGQVYKNLQLAMSQTPGCFERPGWWKSVAERLSSKL